MSNAKEDSTRATILTLLGKNPKLCPQFIRLAFYDAISHDPLAKVDGPHGLIRSWDGSAKDTKMNDALKELEGLQIPSISNADLYQLAGVLAVEKAGGPSIDFQYGRVDSKPIDPSTIQFISEEPLQDFVRKLEDRFKHIGFTDKEIVALFLAPYYWMNTTNEQSPTFDHSFYKKLLKPEDEVSLSRRATSTGIATTPSTTPSKPKDEGSTSKVATSTSITTTPSTTPSSDQLIKSISATPPLHPWTEVLSKPSYYQHVRVFAENPTIIKEEYASAHKKLSELGFKYFPQKVDHQSMKHGYIFAVAVTILVGFVGFFFEVMRA